ncbi:hypothetical protein [Streptomyces sp. NPDC005805]|uniref:hypothetical protein n=1 Tax=Streptomyces sp. NPDC005805 TaxID=3157068 RepID=UPI0033D4B1B4
MVEGDAVPRVEITRAPESEQDEHIPIGTRAPEHLTLTVDGAEAALRPAKGRLSRRSYRVDATYDGAAYRLRPDSVPDSRLTRDGVRLGALTSTGDGRVDAEWRPEAKVRPVDAAVGYALAAAFGTGAQPMWTMVVEALSEALP